MSITALMIDSREPDWVQSLSFDSVPKIVTVLEFGDLWATTDTGEIVIIERKTPTDLLGSIKDNRLFAQIAGMKAKSPWAYLMITGLLGASTGGKVIADNRVTGWDFRSIQGALLSVQEAGIGVIYCDGDDDYEAAVKAICNRNRQAENVIEPRQQSRIMSPGEVMLTALPGIGIERAGKLLTAFDNRTGHTLAWLTWLHNDPCYDIEGIGVGIKKAVRIALKLEETEEFDVINIKVMEKNT